VLRELGCALAQGYQFERPLSVDAAERHLSRGRRRKPLRRVHAA
jgi:EAL domain-containing protein (putative c-di-GMP-specific phosphodiesterase class I)